MAYIEFRDVKKIYKTGTVNVTALDGADFYIEKGDTKVCIYADGHTYHERTEEQAQRDRNIDRELQRLGFIVLRYTGNEIRNDCQKVIDNIKENLPK